MRMFLITLLALPAVGAAQAKPIDPSLLLEGESGVNFNWTRHDSGGFEWDIQADGSISDGGPDVYDSAMVLNIAGGRFGSGGQPVVSPDGRELQLGPWSHRGLQVYRRIYIPEDKQYARFVELLHNPTDEDITVTVEQYVNLGASQQQRRDHAIDDEDPTVYASVIDQGGRPTVGLIYTTAGAEVTPVCSSTPSSDQVYVRCETTVPANQTVGLCYFHIQANAGQGDAVIERFDIMDELSLLPGPVQSVLVNMRGGMYRYGPVEVRRNGEADLAVLTGQRELTGRIAAEQYRLTSSVGELTVPAERVLGVDARDFARTGRVTLATDDGQIVRGAPADATVAFAADGAEGIGQLDWAGVQSLGYRVSDDRPEAPEPDGPILILRDGQRLRFDSDQSWTLVTRFGELTLDGQSLRTLELAGQPMPRVTLANGSTVAGLLTTAGVEAHLTLGAAVTLPTHRVSGVECPARPDDHDGAWALHMRDGSVLAGALSPQTITLNQPEGAREIALEQIASIALGERGLAGVEIALRDGSVLTGQLESTDLTVTIDEGVSLTVYAGLIERVQAQGAAAPEPPDEQATATPARVGPRDASHGAPMHHQEQLIEMQHRRQVEQAAEAVRGQ